ncbi:hypothetical protein IDJ77_14970 [Mucilaginibacter sp. ZT4R22]|uniref:Uncharacterized protein n=1 Tax=Mucilaginibacter pankratovii TaxID=2772110 RepID=A0ABR7WUP4_9SPHI|nr:hypothetical protein [Mucilaginibacter pankratovii]MBD1365119.1 hypothetical protein [Mucilaginibacter pankratovii]
MNLSIDYDSLKTKEDPSTYETLLDIILKHGVITKQVYKKLNPFKLPGNKHTYLGAMYMALQIDAFYRDFTLDNQLDFMKQLKGKNPLGHDDMIGYVKHDQLQQDIQAGKVETYFDFFDYVHRSDAIDMALYQKQPKKLLTKLKNIINKRCYGAFKILGVTILEKNYPGEADNYERKTTITVDTGARKHQHSYTFPVNEISVKHVASFILENILVLVNKLLADYNCDYRFASFTSTLNHELFPAHRNKHVICPLSREQYQIFDFTNAQQKYLHSKPAHLLLSYNLPLSYTHIEYAIYHFNQCGLLAHLDTEQLETTTNSLFNSTYQHTGNLMVAFPGLVAAVNQYVTPGQNPHLAFLEALNDISHGILTFTDIVDGLPENFDYETDMEFTVSFMLNGQQHNVVCHLANSYFAHRLLQYVASEIIPEQYPDYALLNVVGPDYGLHYIMLATKKQATYLTKMNLLLTRPIF